MTALAYGRHRRPLRSFPTTTAENPRRGLVSRMLFALFILAAVVAAGFSVLDLALRTADQVFVDRAALNPPAQADLTFGNHRVSFPGKWLTSPVALEDEMAVTASISLPYEKLLALVGAPSALDTAGEAKDHTVVIRMQMPVAAQEEVDLLNAVYLPKSVPVPAGGPAGLSARRFRDKTGYDNEVLYLGDEGGRLFVARCLDQSPGSGNDLVRRPCLFVHRISADVEAVTQFEPALLSDWRQLPSLVEALIRSITVR